MGLRLDITSINGNIITGWRQSGVVVYGTHTDLSIKDNVICDNNRGTVAGSSGIYVATGVTGTTIDGNTSNNVSGGTGVQEYGINLVGTFAGTVRNNNLTSNTLGPLNIGGAVTGIVENNLGVDDVVSTSVTSATSIAAPVNTTFRVSGTTTITTITGGWTGRRITIYKNDGTGTVAIGGGGNVPLARNLVEGGSITLTYNGTNWY
jgi:hypothetical protein